MGLFASLFTKPSRRLSGTRRQEMSSTFLPLPSPFVPSRSRYEQVRQIVYKIIGQKLSHENGCREIRVSLRGDDMMGSSSMSFQTRDKGLAYPLTKAEQIALLVDVRHELTSTGWQVTSARIYENGYTLAVIVSPAGDHTQILGPSELWPHLQNKQQVIDIAQQDLTGAVVDELTSTALAKGGAYTVDFSVKLPMSCQSLEEEQLQAIVVAIRDLISTKWTVDKFEMAAPNVAVLYCKVSWL